MTACEILSSQYFQDLLAAASDFGTDFSTSYTDISSEELAFFFPKFMPIV
jgi:hypothetical protein